MVTDDIYFVATLLHMAPLWVHSGLRNIAGVKYHLKQLLNICSAQPAEENADDIQYEPFHQPESHIQYHETVGEGV